MSYLVRTMKIINHSTSQQDLCKDEGSYVFGVARRYFSDQAGWGSWTRLKGGIFKKTRKAGFLSNGTIKSITDNEAAMIAFEAGSPLEA